MKKVLFLVSTFCFLAVSTTVAQKAEVKKTEEIKKVETPTAKPAEEKVRTDKAQVKAIPAETKVEIKKVDSSRQIEATKVQKAVVPAKQREEEK